MVIIIHSKNVKSSSKEITGLVDIAKAVSHRLNNALSIALTNSQLAINQLNNRSQNENYEIQNCLYNIESIAIKGGSLIHQFQEFLDYIIDQQLNEKDSPYFDQLISDLQILSTNDFQSFDINSEDKKARNVPTRVGKISILIVDDEKEIRHALSYALTLGGHHVITAPDGKAALDILRNKSYEVVFVDLKMPGMDGLELAGIIKQIDSDITVILMTGWNVQLDQEKLGENIIDAVLSKPFTLTEVYDLITTFQTK